MAGEMHYWLINANSEKKEKPIQRTSCYKRAGMERERGGGDYTSIVVRQRSTNEHGEKQKNITLGGGEKLCLYSIFFFNIFLKSTGRRERTAMAARMETDCRETCPVAVVIIYRVVPARMKKKDGGATPTWEKQDFNNQQLHELVR